MAKIRVHELAEQLNIPSKELIPIIHNLGFEIKSHLSTLEDEMIEKIKKHVNVNNEKDLNIKKLNIIEKNEELNVSNSEEKVLNKEVNSAKSEEKKLNKEVEVSNSEEKVFNKRINVENKKNKEVNTIKTENNFNDRQKNKQKKFESYNKQKSESTTQNNLNKNTIESNEKNSINNKKNIQNKNFKNKDLNQNIQNINKEKNKFKNQFQSQNIENIEKNNNVSFNNENRDYRQNRDMNKNKKNISNYSEDIAEKPVENKKNNIEYSKKDKVKNDLKENRLFSDSFNKKNKNSKVNKNNFDEFEGLTKTQKTKLKKAKKKKEQENNNLNNDIIENVIELDMRMTVADFASAINKSTNEIIIKLMSLGVMASINQYVDFDAMQLVAEEFGINVSKIEEVVDEDIKDYDFEDKEEDLLKRAPVVTVMGHVDHGKTSLLDAIRTTNMTNTEAGGITQHIGASEVKINGEKIVFLDTPGHEAFTSLRARGAKVTDIAILVVAADDGVMPQTIEAIDHAKAANVPIIVAVNKIDKPTANVERVYKELAANGVLVEEWGGDVVSVQVSAKARQNIDGLLEMILIVAEMLDLKANPNRNAVGTVIEANLDKGKGAVATILIQNGSLNVGDPFVCGTTVGKVRAMYNDKGKKIKSAGPSSAVEIIGMSEIAIAGDKFFGIETEREARQIAEKRAAQIKQKELERQGQTVTLEDIFNQIQEGKVKTLDLIIKADVHGSLEAIKGSLLKLNNDEVKINIHHANIGAITESDIMLATASNMIVIGFNVRPSSAVISMAKKEGIEIRTYQIIYNLINDIEAAMKGMLDPMYEEVQVAEVQVRATFKVPNVGVIAGGYVLSGKIERNSKVRLLRQGIIIYDGKLSSLKRFKDDVKEVATGYECGLGIDNFNDLKEGDIIEAYEMKQIERE